MNNKFIIALFIFLALIVLLSSLQTITNLQPKNKINNSGVNAANQATKQTLPTGTPTLLPTSTPVPILHPGYRVNVGGEAGDN